ncbi:MAG: flavodoxin family protein [Pelagimonas sp.]|uniref:flavodoxin family protein n=1 Tax=Pelagimonas sp. TaxID=2073170 RepID=UPI003D6BAE46
MPQSDTPLICLPYFSGSGHTAELARHIATGIAPADKTPAEKTPADKTQSNTVRSRLIDVTDLRNDDWQALDAATLIAFGAPTYMGSTAARFDIFLEEAASRWPNLTWGDKLAAGFTVATHPSGDKLSALMRLSIYGAQMGMIWVGQTSIGAPVFPDAPGLNRDGSWLGLMATASRDKSELISPNDQTTARHFGTRLAATATRWQSGRP